jgi:hypothetical protein
MKEIRKTEKEKKQRREKYEIGPRELPRPDNRICPRPIGKSQTDTLLKPPSLADAGSHTSGRSRLQAWTGKLAGDRFLPAITPSSFPIKSPSVSSPSRAYKTPSQTSSLSLSSPCAKRRQTGAIARRRPRPLRARPADSAITGEP